MIKTKSHKQTTYAQFKEVNGLKSIRKAKTAIVDLEIEILNRRFINQREKDIYLCYVQKIISYVFNSNMIVNIAHRNHHGKSASLFIPKHWERSFETEQLPVSRYLSRIKWMSFVAFLITRSTGKAFLDFIAREDFTLNKLILDQRLKNKEVIMFNPKFPEGNIFMGEPALDFTNWYCQKFMSKKELTFLSFNSKVKRTKLIASNNKKIQTFQLENFGFGIKFYDKIKLLNYSLRLLLAGLVNLLKANPSILVNYHELIFAKRITFIPTNELPNVIIFSDNHGILKPYWVNSFNDSETTVEYFFFSSYDSPTKYEDEDPRQDFWRLNSWPNIYCVDGYQCEFICSNLFAKSQKVVEIGFPYFTDSNENLAISGKPSIALFDFEPRLNHFSASTLSEFGFNTYEFNQLFISGVYEIACELGFVVLHKPKRYKTLELRTAKYQTFLNNLDPETYFSLSPSTSPARLIMNSSCTIAMPITSPGIIAPTLSKESIFFDPYGKIDPKDRAMRGIDIAQDTNELKKFLEEIKYKIFR
jgi:hypothetical protein